MAPAKPDARRVLHDPERWAVDPFGSALWTAAGPGRPLSPLEHEPTGQALAGRHDQRFALLGQRAGNVVQVVGHLFFRDSNRLREVPERAGAILENLDQLLPDRHTTIL